MNDGLPVLVEISRGDIIESKHRGAIIAVEPDGRQRARLGNDALIICTRSTIKPIQAIPFITSGAAARFRVTPQELAVACASHSGQPIHTETVARMLARAGLDESALRCGAHPPYNEESARALECDHKPFTQLHNNCSGKHAGMLLTAVHRGLSTDDYTSIEHPIQREIISLFTAMAGLDEQMTTAIDGCGAPTFGVPLGSLALAFARLVSPESARGLDPADAPGQIQQAMTSHPEMVGGTVGAFDTDLMRSAGGRLICKVGAESVYVVAVAACDRFPQGLGIAVKIEDGAARARAPVVVETLVQLGLLTDGEQRELKDYHRPPVTNYREHTVGEVRPVFDLEFKG